MKFPKLLSVNELRKLTYNNDQDAAKSIIAALERVYATKIFSDQFDALSNLYRKCKVIDQPPFVELSHTLEKIFRYLLDEKDNSNINQKLIDRDNLKEVDPSFIPWRRPQILHNEKNDPVLAYDRDEPSKLEDFYKRMHNRGNLLSIKEEMWYLDRENKVGSETFSQIELEKFRIFAYKGKLLQFKKIGNGDNQTLSFEFFESKNLELKGIHEPTNVKNRGLYTLHLDGSMYVGSGIHPGRISLFEQHVLNKKAIIHPSYSNPGASFGLVGAGEWGETVRGSLSEVDSGSGHYSPDSVQDSRSMSFFAQAKIIHNNTKTTYYHPTTHVYTSIHATKNDRLFYDFAFKNNFSMGKLRLALEAFKKEPTYNLFMWQEKINLENSQWLREGRVIGSTASKTTNALNKKMEIFSNYSDLQDTATAIVHVNDVLQAIDDWRNYHRTSGISSKRTGAVDKLEARMLQHSIDLQLYEICKNISDKPELVVSFLKFEITADEFRAKIKTINSKMLDSHASKEIPPEISSTYEDSNLIENKLEISSTDENPDVKNEQFTNPHDILDGLTEIDFSNLSQAHSKLMAYRQVEVKPLGQEDLMKPKI